MVSNNEVQPVDDWFYYPTWTRSISVIKPSLPTERQRWLVFLDTGGQGEALAAQIEKDGQDVFRVESGDSFQLTGFRKFAVSPSEPESQAALFQELDQRETLPNQIVALWEKPQELQGLVIQVAQHVRGEVQISVVTTSALDVLGNEPPANDSQAAFRGLCLVAGQEYPQLGCRLIDGETNMTASLLWGELRASSPPTTVAYRGGTRWEYDYAALALPESPSNRKGIRAGASYVIVGDFTSELG